ncbi:unnamed protein product, partial [Prunus brigantina]
MDDQNNLMRQLLNQINLAQNLGLGQQGEERRMDEHADSQFDGTQAGRAGVSRQGDGQQRDQLADMIVKKGASSRSRRTNSHRQVTGNPSQTQPTNTPPRQRSREGRPLRTNEEVNQPRPNRKSHQRDRPAICAEDVEKLVNNRLRD